MQPASFFFKHFFLLRSFTFCCAFMVESSLEQSHCITHWLCCFTSRTSVWAAARRACVLVDTTVFYSMQVGTCNSNTAVMDGQRPLLHVCTHDVGISGLMVWCVCVCVCARAYVCACVHVIQVGDPIGATHLLVNNQLCNM